MELIIMAIGTLYIFGWSVFWLTIIGLIVWAICKFAGVIFKFAFYGLLGILALGSLISLLTWSYA